MSDDEETKETTRGKYEVRWAMPFIGWPGMVFYLMDIFVALAMLSAIIDKFNTTAWLNIGILIALVVFSFLFWLANGIWFMPMYETRMAKYSVTEDGLQLMRREQRTYPSKVREDLKAHNDQEHFQGEFVRSVFILIFYACWVGLVASTNSPQPLPFAPDNAAISDYVVGKVFQMMILGSAAWAIGRAAETHSDFMWRHMTAQNEQYRDEHGGRDMKTGGQKTMNNPRRKDASLI